MIWQRVKCSPPWIARLAEALAVCSLVHSRGAQAFNISPYSQARGCWRGCRAASTALRPAVDVEAGSPPSVRDYGRLQALSTTLYGTSAWSTGSYERGAVPVRRRERVPILRRSHSQPHSRPQQQGQGQRHPHCAASSSAEGDNVTTDRVTDDAAAARGSAATGTATAAAVGQDLKAIANATVEGENDQEDEPPLHLVALDEEGEKEQDEQEEEEEEETFPELPEELKEMRGAFLDGPGQYLDVDKILAETEFIGHADVPEGFRTGYVTIVGSPNVGKSTLMNNMIGDRLSIVTPKAGTTRHRITGIMTGTDFQMIYQDTPGVLTPAYMLHEGMMNFVQEAMGDADAVLFVTDLFEVDFAGQEIFERMLASGKPIVVAVNKVDLLPSEGDGSDGEARLGRLSATKLEEVGSLDDILLRWRERLPGATVLPISALEGINTAQLAEELKQHIPVGPPLFANDVMSDKPLRFFAAEIIREQIFVSFSQEIPYSCEVRLERFKERQAETVIDATIIVSQESQKGMVIGKGGAKIKEVGIKARNALEEYLGVRINLRLNVKVDKNWRKKKASLKEYGYIS